MPIPTARVLARPEFGTPPKNPGPDRKRYEFEASLEIVRQHPEQWAKIAVFKGGPRGGRETTKAMAATTKRQVWYFLIRYHPLEHWNVKICRVADTWADKELWVIFHKLMTPEEALAKASERRNGTALRFAGDGSARKANAEARQAMRAVLAANNQAKRPVTPPVG